MYAFRVVVRRKWPKNSLTLVLDISPESVWGATVALIIPQYSLYTPLRDSLHVVPLRV